MADMIFPPRVFRAAKKQLFLTLNKLLYLLTAYNHQNRCDMFRICQLQYCESSILYTIVKVFWKP